MVKAVTNSMGDMVKAGFGLTIGGMLASIMFLIVAMAMFVPGFIMVKKEHKKSKVERNGTTMVVGYVLMGLGMVIGLGFGATTFFSTLSEDI